MTNNQNEVNVHFRLRNPMTGEEVVRVVREWVETHDWSNDPEQIEWKITEGGLEFWSRDQYGDGKYFWDRKTDTWSFIGDENYFIAGKVPELFEPSDWVNNQYENIEVLAITGAFGDVEGHVDFDRYCHIARWAYQHLAESYSACETFGLFAHNGWESGHWCEELWKMTQDKNHRLSENNLEMNHLAMSPMIRHLTSAINVTLGEQSYAPHIRVKVIQVASLVGQKRLTSTGQSPEWRNIDF